MDISFLTFTNPHPEKIVLTKEKSTVKEEEKILLNDGKDCWLT